MTELFANDYLGFLVEIKTRIRQAQYQAFRAVNNELLSLYWDLGESIHQKQEVLGWGKSVVQSLANDLQAEFPGKNGFSAANLWLMRQFYTEYRSRPILEPLVREISWAKNVLIMKRYKDDLAREFYLEALDTQERLADENHSIGIIICWDKNKTVVEYALRTARRPIGVATYTVSAELPEAYRAELPSPEAIAERLKIWDVKEAEDE